VVVSGSCFTADTRVTAVTRGTSPDTMTISLPALVAGSGADITFYRSDYALPTTAPVKWVYDCRLTSSPRILQQITQRDYDLLRPGNESSTPTHYSLYAMGNDGYIRFLPPNYLGSERAVLRYCRAMSGTADPLDIPSDFEPYIIALAKAYFLADKGGNPERMQFWWNVAMEGLDKARAAAVRSPDYRAAFRPDIGISTPAWNPNDVRTYLE
jgi:hypothetical protein